MDSVFSACLRFVGKWGGGGGLVIKPLLTVEPELSPLDNSSTRSGSGWLSLTLVCRNMRQTRWCWWNLEAKFQEKGWFFLKGNREFSSWDWEEIPAWTQRWWFGIHDLYECDVIDVQGREGEKAWAVIKDINIWLQLGPKLIWVFWAQCCIQFTWFHVVVELFELLRSKGPYSPC